MTQALTSKPLTVGSISSLEELQNLDSDHTPQFDILEVRLDGIPKNAIDDVHWLCLRVKSWGMPILITARDVSEGGIHPFTVEERTARLQRFAEVATYFDIEIANFPEFKTTAKSLQGQGIKMVLSYHNFELTPDNLQEQLDLAISYGADIPKFAVMLNSIQDVMSCAEFIQSVETPISLMGMGALAPVSRVLCAQLGSVLNYGYLGDTPTAPGQWSSELLKKAIANCEPL